MIREIPRSSIPQECIEDCTQPGQDASEPTKHWVKRLEFAVNRDAAIRSLKEWGCWDDETYPEMMTDFQLATWILWDACNVFNEGYITDEDGEAADYYYGD